MDQLTYTQITILLLIAVVFGTGPWWRALLLGLVWSIMPTPAKAVDVVAGQDIYHRFGTSEYAVRWGDPWVYSVGRVGAANTLGLSQRLTFGRMEYTGGLVYFDHVDSVAGTRLNFDWSARYAIDKHHGVEFRHVSHGAFLGIARSVPNAGWNLLGYSYRF